MDISTARPGQGWRRDPRPFPHHHKADRNFFLLFLILCWAGVVMGFAPAAAKRYAGNADYEAPLVLQVHVFAFTAWLLLLSIQILLVRTRRASLHRRLGPAGAALIPVMAVTAYVSEVYSQRFYFDHPPNSQAFFILPIAYVIAFTVLAGAALLLRGNPSAHKRLILLATTIIVGAAYARWWGAALAQAFGDGFWGTIVSNFTGTNLLLGGAVAFDLATRRRVHPVYAVCVPAVILGELAVSYIYHSPHWLPVARFLIGR